MFRPRRLSDAAAASLGDVLTLAQPRTDDPLKGVVVPVANTPHPNQSQPSTIDKIQARRVSQLPLRNEEGSYDRHTPPDLSSSDAVSDYIQNRTAAWTQHLQRLRQRRRKSLRKPPIP